MPTMAQVRRTANVGKEMPTGRLPVNTPAQAGRIHFFANRAFAPERNFSKGFQHPSVFVV